MIVIDKTTKPIATWYKTNSWRWEIEAVPVLKVTSKQLVIINPFTGAPSIVRKVGYHPTKEAALEYLQERIQRLRTQLASAEAKLAATEDKWK